MKKIFITMSLISSIVTGSYSQADSRAINQKATEIVSKMTLEEKIGQMAQITIDAVCMGTDATPDNPLRLDEEKLKDAIINYHVGSILNAPNTQARTAEWWNDVVEKIQQVATNETRMKIPVIYGLDQIHGSTYTAGSTMFPQEINIAATWQPKYARTMGEITAYETRASNVPWNFSPVLDLGADPRFSRQYEGFGEDPYILSVFGYELIKGYEGDDNNIANPQKLAACMKHFLGYSVPVSGKDRTPAYIPMNILLEYHVPPFQAAIDAGVHTVMINSGIINNEPVHASHYLLTTLLRDKMGFKGVVVSDWEDINKLHIRDKISPTIKDAIEKGINAGIDMSMIPIEYKVFCTSLKELVDEGKVSMNRIDEATIRIIALKLDLNLFEVPNTYRKDYPDFNSEKSKKDSYEAASESITLLKNENNTLPVKKGAKILVTGPNAVSKRALNGGWTYSWQGEKINDFATGYNHILTAVEQKFGKENVVYVPGVSYTADTEYNTEYKDKFEQAVLAAGQADYVLLCLGENSYAEKPGDLDDLYLNDLQTELAKEILKKNKKTILILSEGRPRIISKFSKDLNAIVQTYLPGIYGADALADILAGETSPSGKLPYTYPMYPNALIPYFHKPADQQKRTEGAYLYEGDYKYEYPFGFGLSYTTFKLSNVKIDKKRFPFNSQETVTITVDVTNIGNMNGKEVVQLYSSDLYASSTPDVKRLRRFEKVSLKPGESKNISFEINVKDLSFINLKNESIVEPGDFEFQIGTSSENIEYVLPFTVY